MKRDWKLLVPQGTIAAEPGVTRQKNGVGFSKELSDMFPPNEFPRLDVLLAEGCIGFRLGSTGAFSNPKKCAVKARALAVLPRWEGALPTRCDDPDVTFYIVLPGANPPVLEESPPVLEANPPVLDAEPAKPRRTTKEHYHGPHLNDFDPRPYLSPGGVRGIATSASGLSLIALSAANLPKQDSPLTGGSVVDKLAPQFGCKKSALARFLQEFGPFIEIAEKLPGAEERKYLADCWTEAFAKWEAKTA